MVDKKNSDRFKDEDVNPSISNDNLEFPNTDTSSRTNTAINYNM